jgi:phage shock protein E
MKTKASILFVLLIAFGKITGYAQVSKSTVVENVDAKTFSDDIAKNKGQLIDLRTPAEIEKGYIKGALFIDFTDKGYEQEFAKLDKNKVVYLYCAGGGRSSSAAEYMQEHGFKKIVNLQKGFNDWKKHGQPVELKK